MQVAPPARFFLNRVTNGHSWNGSRRVCGPTSPFFVRRSDRRNHLGNSVEQRLASAPVCHLGGLCLSIRDDGSPVRIDP